MSEDILAVDAATLREEVKQKYREVAVDPHGDYHFGLWPNGSDTLMM